MENIIYKVIDNKFRKSDGFLFWIKLRIELENIENENLVSDEIEFRLFKSKEFIPINELTEESIISWIEEKKLTKLNLMRLENLVKNLKKESQKEIKVGTLNLS